MYLVVATTYYPTLISHLTFRRLFRSLYKKRTATNRLLQAVKLKKRSLASSHAFGSSGLSQEVRIAGSAKRSHSVDPPTGEYNPSL